MDTAQWPQQGIGLVKGSVEGSQQIRQPQIQVERRVRPHKEQSLNCPRCNSTNTKFCYYNNYSLSQPRYFCKTCRRYWTEGGSLRNVPVGGGSRKNKRNSSSSSSHSSSSTAHSSTICSSSSSNSSSIPATSSTIPLPSSTSLLMPKFFQGVHDLNLSFPNQSLGSLSALEMLRTGFVGPSVFGSSGFGFQELMRPADNSNLKPQTLEGFGGGMDEGGDGRLLFPFEDLKQVSMTNCGSNEGMVNTSINTNTSKYEQGDTTLFWNGIMGGNNGGGEAHGRGGSW